MSTIEDRIKAIEDAVVSLAESVRELAQDYRTHSHGQDDRDEWCREAETQSIPDVEIPDFNTSDKILSSIAQTLKELSQIKREEFLKSNGFLPSEPKVAGPSPVYTCKACKDTHLIHNAALEREVMCTLCPVPCKNCANNNGRGAFCDRRNCDCLCHSKEQPSVPRVGSDPRKPK